MSFALLLLLLLLFSAGQWIVWSVLRVVHGRSPSSDELVGALGDSTSTAVRWLRRASGWDAPEGEDLELWQLASEQAGSR